ncbi:MAG: hypothetical protein PUG68_03480 [Lachnospiraceae bacterium]|nr:hypothetical protein [Lachnospiraceae bacterium]MDY2760315.1 hypothetical protein [Lachnospiraceae bacterium]
MAEKEATWPGPEGMIPALPRDASNASFITRRYLDEIWIEERSIGTGIADLTYELWGRQFSSPIMMPAFSHLNKVGTDSQPTAASMTDEMRTSFWHSAPMQYLPAELSCRPY